MPDHLDLAKTLATVEIPGDQTLCADFDRATRTAQVHALIAIAERLPKPEPDARLTAALDRLIEVRKLAEYAQAAGQSVLNVEAVLQALEGWPDRQALNDIGGIPSPSDSQGLAESGVDSPRAKLSRFSEDGITGRCTSSVTLRDEEHRLVRCWLPEGHAGDHDDLHGVTWTGGQS